MQLAMMMTVKNAKCIQAKERRERERESDAQCVSIDMHIIKYNIKYIIRHQTRERNIECVMTAAAGDGVGERCYRQPKICRAMSLL